MRRAINLFCMFCLYWLCGLAATFAQTNQAADAPASAVPVPVIFDQLLSASNSVLMTNAEFRQSFGRKLVFKSGLDLQSFDIGQLHPSVLKRLGLDPAGLAAAQKKLDDENKAFAVQRQQAQAVARNQPPGGYGGPGSRTTYGTGYPAPVAPGAMWHTPQPVRLERKPVDLSDSRACLYELAELASFYMYFNNPPHNAGFDFNDRWGSNDEDGKNKVLDAIVRLDQLARARDPEIRRLAAETREMVTEFWRLHRAEQDLGWLRLRHEAGNQATFAIGSHLFLKGLDAALDPATQTTAQTHYTSAGPMISYNTVTRDGPSALGAAADQLYSDQMAQLEADTHKTELYVELLNHTRAAEYDELAGLWQKELLPRLKAANKSGGARALLRGVPYAKAWFGGDFEELRAVTLTLQNASGQSLSNVVVDAQLTGTFGDVTHWYGFIRNLPNSGAFSTEFVGEAGDVINKASTLSHGTVDVFSANGWQEGLPVKLERAESYAFEDPSPYGSMAQMKLYRDTMVQHAGQLQPNIRQLRANMRTAYGSPVNPVDARPKLTAAIASGKEYRVVPNGRQPWASETLTIGQLNDPTNLITAKLSVTTKIGALESLDLVGRFREEYERGYVLGFVPRSQIVPQAWFSRVTWLVTSPAEITNVRKDQQFYWGGIMEVMSGQHHRGPDPQSEEGNTRAAEYVVYVDDKGRLSLQSSPSVRPEIEYFRLE
jgi:hypothetical protein